MNKKQLSIISVVFVLSILVVGCNPAGDQSPSSRLVGHWEAPYETEDLPREIFLGELSTDGEGKLYMTSDFVNFCERTYEIISEDEDTYNIRFYRDYTSNYEDYSIEFRDEGFILLYDGEFFGDFTYVDTETEPDNFSTLATENEYLTTTSITGHWGYIPEADSQFDENLLVYFGRINNDGEGIHYLSIDNDPSKYSFKIIREDGGDYDLRIQHECGGSDDISRWEVSEDRQNLNLFLEDEIPEFEFFPHGFTKTQFRQSCRFFISEHRKIGKPVQVADEPAILHLNLVHIPK